MTESYQACIKSIDCKSTSLCWDLLLNSTRNTDALRDSLIESSENREGFSDLLARELHHGVLQLAAKSEDTDIGIYYDIVILPLIHQSVNFS
jgi:hypothetical protein